MSHQEIVDCAEKGYGCRGGFPMAAYEHILNQGISPASKYPYSGSQGKCQKKSGDAVRMKFSPMGGKPFTMKEVRRVLVEENKFVSIGLAPTRAFSSLSNTPDYFDASATGDCKSGVNHVIAIVDIDSKEIVTILNSWGKGWGEKGFNRMKPCSSTNLYGDGAILSHP